MNRVWGIAPMIRQTIPSGYRARCGAALALLGLHRRRWAFFRVNKCTATVSEDAIGDPGSWRNWERWEWSDWGADYVRRRHRVPVPKGFGQGEGAVKRRRLAELISDEERLEEVRLMLRGVVDAKWATLATWIVPQVCLNL